MAPFSPSSSRPGPASSWALTAAFVVAAGVVFTFFAMAHALFSSTPTPVAAPKPAANAQPVPPKNIAAGDEVVTLGGGCFWCVEAVYQRIEGVKKVTSGYMGGTLKNPTYLDVCTGLTGHAEVVQIEFDPKVVTFDEILDWFWRLHDPTTLNRQGADTGTQYRSVIFYYNDTQKAAAEKARAEAQPSFPSPIVTEITPAGEFYSAEDSHQDFYNLHTAQGYCTLVIKPKLDKLHLDDTAAAKKVPASALPPKPAP